MLKTWEFSFEKTKPCWDYKMFKQDIFVWKIKSWYLTTVREKLKTKEFKKMTLEELQDELFRFMI